MKMNKIIRTSVLLSFMAVAMVSCGKFDLFTDMSNGVPKVEMVSVENMGDSVLVTAKVISEGGAPVSTCGFCYNSTGSPTMDENQILVEGSVGEFSVLIRGLKEDSTYYFKAFATNQLGYYNVSGTKSAVIPRSGPPVVPCSLTDDVISEDGMTSNISSTYAGVNVATIGGYGVNSSYNIMGMKTIKLNFHSKPKNGIYRTSDYASFNQSSKNVYAEVHMGMSDYTISSGGLIYVQEIDTVTLAVSFCELKYTPNSTTIKVKGRIIVK